MGKRDNINEGASAACLVVAVLVGLLMQSFWAGVVALFVVGGILVALRIIR